MKKNKSTWQEINTTASSTSSILCVPEEIDKQLNESLVYAIESDKNFTINSPFLGSVIFLLGDSITNSK